MTEYNQPVEHQKRKAAFHDFARHLGQDVEKRDLTEEEFMAELEQTKRQVFFEQYGHCAHKPQKEIREAG